MVGCQYFKPSEIFHPSFIEKYGEQGVWYIRPQIIWDRLDSLREAWGKPIYINRSGGKYSGVRPIDTTFGALKSRHKPIYDNVQALDLHGRDHGETHDLFMWVEERGHDFGVERLESYLHTPGWVHCEICTGDTPIRPRIFKP